MELPTHAMNHRPAVHRWILLAVVAFLCVAGYLGSWLPHKASGLAITGLDLAEYVKFLPEVASGQIPVRREVFYIPLMAGSLTATLLASRCLARGLLPGILLLLAIMLALAQLPPAWSPTTLRLAEFRIQIVAILACGAVAPLVVVLRRLPDRVILSVLSALALVAAIGPGWSYLQVKDAIAAVYHASSPLGWGFWLCLIGNGALAFIGLAFALGRNSPRTRG